MSNHTPGPWAINYCEGLLPHHVAIDAPKHGELAQVVWVMEDDARIGRSTPTCEANARLIAAAPDLLEALKRIKATGVFVGAIAQEMMDAAIAKAEDRA